MPKNNTPFSQKDLDLIKLFVEGEYDEDTMGSNTNTVKGDEIQMTYIGAFDSLWLQALDGTDLMTYELSEYTDDSDQACCGVMGVCTKNLSSDEHLQLFNRIQEASREFERPVPLYDEDDDF